MISLKRIQAITLVIGLIGALAFWILRSASDAGGFLVGAAFSLVGLRSWQRVAGSELDDAARAVSTSCWRS